MWTSVLLTLITASKCASIKQDPSSVDAMTDMIYCPMDLNVKVRIIRTCTMSCCSLAHCISRVALGRGYSSSLQVTIPTAGIHIPSLDLLRTVNYPFTYILCI